MSVFAAGDSRSAILRTLAEQVRQLEQARSPGPRRLGSLPSPSPTLDAILPEQGFRRGTLVQWLADGPGCGAATLAVVAAREACRAGGALAVIELASGPPATNFYPPAAAALGIDLERLILLRPANEADHDWAVHQALGCPAVAALLCWPDDKLDGRMFRRWQLAAETGGGLGLLVQSNNVVGQPSWADVQLRVRPLPTAAGVEAPRGLAVELLRCRGGRAGGSVQLEIDEATGVIHAANARDLAASLADSTALRGA